jgi:hypothetical protein
MKRDVAALVAYIDSKRSVPWEWGANDCVSFVLGAVEAQTGVKVREVKWKSRATALRTLKKFGTIEAAFDAHFKRIPPAFAKRGDIAGVHDKDFGIHPMIVEGSLLVSPGDKGNERALRRHMTTAWSIEP